MGFFEHFRLQRLNRDRRGAMLVEFALVLPGFFVLLLGGLAVADAISAYNRLQNVAMTVGGMSSRLKVISNEDIVGIASAARAQMFPFPADNLSILLATVWIDDMSVPTLLWCERWGLTKPTGVTCSGSEVVGNSDIGYWVAGANLTIEDLRIPSGILNPNTGIVVTHVSYDWDAPFAPVSAAQLTDFTLKDIFFYAPRADVSLTPPSRDRDSTRPTSSFKVRG